MEKSNRFKIEIEVITLENELLDFGVVSDIIVNNLKHNFAQGRVNKITSLKAVEDGEFCMSHSCPLDDNGECPRCKEE